VRGPSRTMGLIMLSNAGYCLISRAGVETRLGGSLGVLWSLTLAGGRSLEVQLQASANHRLIPPLSSIRPIRRERPQDHQLRTTEARTEAVHVQSPGKRALSPASWKELFAPPSSLSTEERPWLCGPRGQTAACAPASETFGGQKPSDREY
jgi:hypothetical protein